MNGNSRGLIYSILSLAIIVLGIVFFIKALPFIILIITTIYVVYKVRHWYLSRKYKDGQNNSGTSYNTYSSSTYTNSANSNSSYAAEDSNSKVIDVDFEEVDK